MVGLEEAARRPASRIIRPRQLYTGPTETAYIPIE